MGNDLETEKQLLLLGPKGHGKTLFLYSNVLKGSKDSIREYVEPSVSYNYEVITFREEKFGIWDLPGSAFFRKLWKYFYRNIPLRGVIYMVLVKAESDGLAQEATEHNENKNRDPLLEARKNLHFVLNEPELKNAFVIVVFNLKDPTELSPEEKAAKKPEYEKRIKFSKIQNEMKASVVLSACQSEFDEFVDKVLQFDAAYEKKNKKDKEKDKDKASEKGDAD